MDPDPLEDLESKSPSSMPRNYAKPKLLNPKPDDVTKLGIPTF